VFQVETKIRSYLNKKIFSFGANGPFVFGNAIPALASISALRFEDAGSIGAMKKVIFLFIYFWL
jgi:hypothetical protein